VKRLDRETRVRWDSWGISGAEVVGVDIAGAVDEA
jgi:hypothetical protein